MTLTWLDWAVIVLYFLLNLAIGAFYYRRAKSSTSEFFLGGRDVPWWLAGTSMVATTFAADTPLAVTGFVARNGIAGNWIWWNLAMSGILTVFLYARLWRRAEVMTDVEFAEFRYRGKPAAFLRGFRALYLALPINCIIMGWVNLAMVKILKVTLGLSSFEAMAVVAGMLLFTTFYTTLSGLWGVLVTDLFQFVLKMGMVTLLAILAVQAVGGMSGLVTQIQALDVKTGYPGSRLSFWPDTLSTPMLAILVNFAVIWWASWMPGSEPGGGGYVAQRIFSAKDERNGVLATLWFNLAHYALRPWPWILTALASLVLYPDLADKETGYIRTLMDPQVFPPALRGLMLAAFAAAYMSTIGTQLNWGASYIINDFYRRFCRKEAPDRHYVLASQAVTLLLMVLSLLVTAHLDSIARAWKLLLVTGAGTGTVLLARWFWWRINAWSEVTAMASAAACSIFLQVGLGLDSDDPGQFAQIMLITTAFCVACWVGVTYLTPAESDETLEHFYRKVRPEGPGWTTVAARCQAAPPGSLIPHLLQWVLGCLFIYSALFGAGKILFGEYPAGLALLALAVFSGVRLARSLESGTCTRPDVQGERMA